MFSESDINYLKSQRLARFATVSKKFQPDVVPVAFEFDGTNFWVGSHSQDIFFKTQKYFNVKNGNTSISMVIDDLESVSPWKPRGIKIKGKAELLEHEGMFGKGMYIKIIPSSSHSWGIE